MKYTIQIALGLSMLAQFNISDASSWNYTGVGNSETIYYFDADTVEKHKDKAVAVWIKTVQTTAADEDGSWATAYRWRLNCGRRTIQNLAWSTYDKDGKFIKSGSPTGTEQAVTPDSTGESMLKIACDPTFPNDTSGKTYFKLENNDVFQATQKFVKYKQSQIDQAPK